MALRSDKTLLESSLPKNWKRTSSKVGGRTQTYYYNTVTRQTATDPHSLPEELPKHWEEAVDKKSGERYYWNVKTRETRRTPPGVEIRSGRLQSHEGIAIAPCGPSPSDLVDTPAHSADRPAQVVVTVTTA